MINDYLIRIIKKKKRLFYVEFRLGYQRFLKRLANIGPTLRHGAKPHFSNA